jgi:hypothetical protein
LRFYEDIAIPRESSRRLGAGQIAASRLPTAKSNSTT